MTLIGCGTTTVIVEGYVVVVYFVFCYLHQPSRASGRIESEMRIACALGVESRWPPEPSSSRQRALDRRPSPSLLSSYGGLDGRLLSSHLFISTVRYFLSALTSLVLTELAVRPRLRSVYQGMHGAVRADLPLLASPRTLCDRDVQD